MPKQTKITPEARDVMSQEYSGLPLLIKQHLTEYYRSAAEEGLDFSQVFEVVDQAMLVREDLVRHGWQQFNATRRRHGEPSSTVSTTVETVEEEGQTGTEQRERSCPYCDTPVSKKALKQHKRRFHPAELENEELEKAQATARERAGPSSQTGDDACAKHLCPYCNVPVKKKSLAEHKRRFHLAELQKEEEDRERACPYCDVPVTRQAVWRHCRTMHPDKPDIRVRKPKKARVA